MSSLRTKLAAEKEKTIALQKLVEVGEEARRSMHNTIQDLKGSVRVYVRARPFLKSDNEDPSEHQVRFSLKEFFFTFGSIGWSGFFELSFFSSKGSCLRFSDTIICGTSIVFRVPLQLELFISRVIRKAKWLLSKIGLKTILFVQLPASGGLPVLKFFNCCLYAIFPVFITQQFPNRLF